MPFKGDIPCAAHILNIVVQAILKSILKNKYNLNYSTQATNIEKDKENTKDLNSKF